MQPITLGIEKVIYVLLCDWLYFNMSTKYSDQQILAIAKVEQFSRFQRYRIYQRRVICRGAPDLEFSNSAGTGFTGFETRHFEINWDSLVFKNGGLNYNFDGF